MNVLLYIVFAVLMVALIAWQVYLMRMVPAADGASRGVRALRWVNIVLLAIGLIVAVAVIVLRS